MRKTLNLPSYQMPINEIRDHLIDKLSVLFNKYDSNISDSRLEGGGVNRAKLKFTKIITTTSRG
jgi:hypothetical protein